MPVMRDHLTTHQWNRELRRFRKVPKVVVQFRIPDRDMVSVGAYNSEKIKVTASEAIGIVREHQAPFGLEVIVPRKISSKEIMKFYTPPKVVGWRYWPESHGHKPCPCPFCQKGMPYSKKLREKFDDEY